MPELPEVETIARSLRPALIGQKIVGAEVHWPRTVAAPTVAEFRRNIRGQVIRAVDRRAKFLHVRLSTSHLLIHLRMSGDLQIRDTTAHAERHDRLVLVLEAPKQQGRSRGREARRYARTKLVFNDTRKFGRVWLTEDLEDITRHLGPEPLSRSFTPQVLHDLLNRRNRRLKPLLLDQSLISGLGNIYTDEALHIAKLHPLRSSRTITRPQAERLYNAIRSVLRQGIRRNGASIDWVYRGGDFQNHFRVYGRTGEPCPVCGTAVIRLLVGQRGTHICPRCQRI